MFKFKNKQVEEPVSRVCSTKKYPPEVILDADVSARYGYVCGLSIQYSRVDYLDAIKWGMDIIEKYISTGIDDDKTIKAKEAFMILCTYCTEQAQHKLTSTVSSKEIAGAEEFALMLFRA